MVEDVASMVDIEKVLRRLSDGSLRVVLEIGQHVLQKVGVCLHIGVKDYYDVIVARPLFSEDVEFECRINVARLAMNGHTRPLVPREVDQTLVTHLHALLLALEVPAVIKHVHVHLGPFVLELQRRLTSGEHKVRWLVVAWHAAVHYVSWLYPGHHLRRRLVVCPRLREADDRKHHHANRAEHLSDANCGLVVHAVRHVPLNRVQPSIPKVGR
jgi:hypothetical protein